MNKMEVFNNQEFGNVRAFLKDGEPWFVAKDVCDILNHSNSRKALARLDEDEKGVTTSYTLGGNQELSCINESGLYSLILTSRKPEAKRFKKWVTAEVLPAIRKTGRYEMIEEDPEDLLSKALLYVNSKLEAKEVELEQKKHEIADLKPKATYYDLILQCSGLLSITQIAKDYGMSAVTMNRKLQDLGVQYKKKPKGQWHLYQKYADEGYVGSKTQNIMHKNGKMEAKLHTYWTQKGRQFLYDFLKEHDILPKIEQMELVRV